MGPVKLSEGGEAQGPEGVDGAGASESQPDKKLDELPPVGNAAGAKEYARSCLGWQCLQAYIEFGISRRRWHRYRR